MREAAAAMCLRVFGLNLRGRVIQITNPQHTNQITIGYKISQTSHGIAILLGSLAFGLMSPPQIFAQQLAQSHDSGAQARFAQASIKQSHATDKFSHREIRADGLTDSNVTVRELIEFAYGVQSYQIASVVDWIDSERFDVEGKFNSSTTAQGKALAVDSNTTPPAAGEPRSHSTPVVQLPSGQLQTMLKGLLEDRFHLKLKRESRESPIYDLVVAKSGVKLTTSTSTPTAPNGEPIISERQRISNGTGEFTMNGPVSALAGFLSQQLSREVVDKTGLKGNYLFMLQWKSNQSATESISAALQDELGLQLESRQGPVETLTVEQVEKPAEQ